MKPVTEYATTVCTARIDQSAITHNVRVLAAQIAPATLMAVVKADAYGHGIAHVVPAALAGGVRDFGVATVPEALQLADLLGELAAAGTPGAAEARILAWLYDVGTDLAEAVAAGIELALPGAWALDPIIAAGRTAGVVPRVHLKCDTGLGRNGFTPEQLAAFLPALSALDAAPAAGTPAAGADVTGAPLRIVGIMTHLAKADEPGDPATAEQLEVFEAFIGRIRSLLEAHPGLGTADELDIHAANTPGALALDPFPGTMARVGLGVYGLSPFPEETPADLGLRPAMSLRSRVLTVKEVAAGHGASYGYMYRAPQDTRFALVAGGYADGIPRTVSGRAEVLIGGRRYPQVGRIAMDQFIVDLGPADHGVAPGDEAVLFGPDAGAPTADDWAGWAETINYEFVTCISGRVARVAGESGEGA